MSTQTAVTDRRQTESSTKRWKYLRPRKSSWKQQLFVMGTRLPASVVWTSMLVNHDSIEEAAHDWDLTVEVVEEIVKYCEENEALLDAEDQEERRRAEEMGIRLEPPPVR